MKIVQKLKSHANTHYTQSHNADVVNMNNLRIKYNNNNNLHSFFDMS